MISPATIDQVRDLSIVDVVGKYVELKKVGANYRGLSPFSNEKTPSFYVVPSKQIFKDFSSGKGGGVIAFVMEKLGLNYPDAIKTLAAENGIRVEYESNGHAPEHYDEIESLYKINHAAANAYAQELLNIDGSHPAFNELINKRRFTPDTLIQWQIGWAPGDTSGGYTPSKWNFLTKRMIDKGYYKQGHELGLIQTKNDVNYDTFRARIIFPILDDAGRYVAFGARSIAPDEYNAKYLNSPESKIFNKSKVLFGLHFASAAIRKAGYANLMEGYTDVISFHQAGQANTVGTCGTALTDDQCKQLKKYTDKVSLINDPDEAGQNAAMRSVDLLMRHGFQVAIVPMPSIVETKDHWREVVFITERAKDLLRCKHDGNEFEFEMSRIETIEKIDPDALVRMF